MWTHRQVISTVLALTSVLAPAQQDPPWNMRLLSRFDLDGHRWGGIWGDGNLIFGGHYGQPIVTILDVSNPANPIVVSHWQVPPPNETCSAQEVKGGNGLLFIALEYNQRDAIEIVDIRNPWNPRHLAWVVDTTPGLRFDEAHCLYYDAETKFLYQSNSRDAHVAIYDLRDFDPDNPRARISQAKWIVHTEGGMDHDEPVTNSGSSGGSVFVHDMVVNNGLMFVANWDGGIQVWDVSKVSEEPPVFLTSAPGDNVHSVWPTYDNRFIVTCEERPAGITALYELVPGKNGIELVLCDHIIFPPEQAFTPHNPFFVDYRLYLAAYQAGVQVYDIDLNNKRLVRVASYDTSSAPTNGYAGCWGAYPFSGKKRIYAADIENGLHVIADDAPWRRQLRVESWLLPNGIHAGGTTASLWRPDGDCLIVQVDPALATETSATSITEFVFRLEGNYVSELGLTLRSRADWILGRQTWQLFDWQTDSWVTVLSLNPSWQFSTTEVQNIPNFGRFIQPTSFEVRLRATEAYWTVSPLVYGARSYYDQASLNVLYE